MNANNPTTPAPESPPTYEIVKVDSDTTIILPTGKAELTSAVRKLRGFMAQSVEGNSPQLSQAEFKALQSALQGHECLVL